MATGLPARAIGFPSFVDAYSLVPYLYFSTGKAENSYPNAIAAPNPNLAVTPPYNMPFVAVGPYRRSSTQFVNPSSFQIVSAGKDQTFGQGGLAWAGASGGAATQQAYDDMANFHPSVLGVPNQ